MQLAGWVSAGVLLAGTALAAQGDGLVVTGSNVNVRGGPSTDAGVLVRVGVDAPAIERRRQGSWIEVALPEQNVVGWIHESLLAPAPGPAPAAGPVATGSVPAGPVNRGDVARKAPAVPSAGRVTEVAAADAKTATGATASTPADSSPLVRFRNEVAYFNDRAVAAAGVDLFTDVAPLGEGGVQVVTTDAWATMPQPGQQSYLNALFGRWRAAAGPGQALRLQIVDASGALMMETTGP